MSNSNEQKIQKHFVKDGDDEYVQRRPIRRTSATPRQPYKTCDCSGKLKPRGATGPSGQTSAKCNRCGKRTYMQIYKGKDGLVVCY